MDQLGHRIVSTAKLAIPREFANWRIKLSTWEQWGRNEKAKGDGEAP
jgi:hypothetical protein